MELCINYANAELTHKKRYKMEKTIYKYKLDTIDKQTIQLPKEAEILTIQTQNVGIFEEPYLWALVDPNKQLENRVIEIFGTGHPVTCERDIHRKYISTYKLLDGRGVFHAFELIY